jgi:hypothetical protein
MLLGLLRPLATNCALHPEARLGAAYEGANVEHDEEDVVVVWAVAMAKKRDSKRVEIIQMFGVILIRGTALL